MCTPALREFILTKCEFRFFDTNTRVFFNSSVGRYVGLQNNGKHLICFEASDPKPSTFFHELGHAYLGHKAGFNEELHEKQENEANEFARRVLYG